ncbi:protein chibby homolog 1-like [Clytia hemisphaerica]|uniref:Uncharacterized protein n=1 Tax=Clytia hemisphaerica TaxID=252671 RepID=A0A7M5X2I3_9CNID
MPLFGKASFKASRKVPKRKADAGSTDPSQLSDKSALDPNLDFSQTPLKLSLGGQKMIFQNGVWIATDEQGSQSSMRDNDLSHAAKEKILTLEEENNMLKYKIELLLDMLAVSQSDIQCMEQEINQMKKAVGNKDSGYS